MTKQERAEYMREYNAAGYRKKRNRAYYLKHRDEILQKAKARRDGGRRE